MSDASANNYAHLEDPAKLAALKGLQEALRKQPGLAGVEVEKISRELAEADNGSFVYGSAPGLETVKIHLRSAVAEASPKDGLKLGREAFTQLAKDYPVIAQSVDTMSQKQHTQWLHDSAAKFVDQNLLDPEVLKWSGFNKNEKQEFPTYKHGHALEINNASGALNISLDQTEWLAEGLTESLKEAGNKAIDGLKTRVESKFKQEAIQRLTKKSKEYLGADYTPQQIKTAIDALVINATVQDGKFGKSLNIMIQSPEQAAANMNNLSNAQALQDSNILSKLNQENLNKLIGRAILFDDKKPIEGFAAIAGAEDIKAMFKRMERFVTKLPPSPQTDEQVKEVKAFLDDPMFHQTRWGEPETKDRKSPLLIDKGEGTGELRIAFSMPTDQVNKMFSDLAQPAVVQAEAGKPLSAEQVQAIVDKAVADAKLPASQPAAGGHTVPSSMLKHADSIVPAEKQRALGA